MIYNDTIKKEGLQEILHLLIIITYLTKICLVTVQWGLRQAFSRQYDLSPHKLHRLSHESSSQAAPAPSTVGAAGSAAGAAGVVSGAAAVVSGSAAGAAGVVSGAAAVVSVSALLQGQQV